MKAIARSTLLMSLLAASCALQAADPPRALKSVRIDGVPHVRQKEDFCGEACAGMYLAKLGHNITQDDVFNVSGVDPALGRGCHTKDMRTALLALGVKPGSVWYKVKAGSGKELQELWKALHADLVKGIPSIVCMRTGNSRSATEHMRLVLGYNRDEDKILYHEPGDRRGAYEEMKLDTFLDLWPLKYSRKEWTVIRLKLDVDKIRPPKRSEGFSNADYAQHIMKLKRKIPRSGFSYVIEKPFVVIGDEPPSVVRLRADKTVKWATLRLKHMYFKRDPSDIIDIWLFKDNASYRKHTREIFNDTPDTPFGYSSSVHKALIMNIGTGGGTLVHEIVHPFIAANFPECPAWLNEGLGSLYEQSSGDGKRIVGLTNWRLAGLQAAIKKGHVPSFKTLTGTTTHEFYFEDPGTNYSQSRYLCYYLQEKHLLTKFYHAFQSNIDKDPTGYETLKRTLGEEDMDAFKKKWQEYVLGLKFRG